MDHQVILVHPVLTRTSADLDEMRRQRDHWKANHDDMVARNAVLRDRPDLPADRLEALARLEGEWNFDMQTAPRDGSRIMLAVERQDGTTYVDTAWWESAPGILQNRWIGGHITTHRRPYAWRRMPLTPLVPVSIPSDQEVRGGR